MTTILLDREAVIHSLTDAEVEELSKLTADLPQLVTGYSAALPLDPALRLDAALWQAAERHGIEIKCSDSVFDVVDRLSANGWSGGHARNALRAFTMLRWSSGRDLRAAARVISYLELRTCYG